MLWSSSPPDGLDTRRDGRPERTGKRILEQTEQRAFELSLILVHEDEAELEKADREFDTGALARMRSMPAAAVADLRKGRGALFAELSDWLLVRDRRAARLKRVMKADPELPAIFNGRMIEGQPAGAA